MELHIRDVDPLAFEQGASGDRATSRFDRYIPDELSKLRSVTIAYESEEGCPLFASNGALVGAGKAGGRFQQCFQHRLQIEGRAADGLEHVGGRSLLL